MFVIFGAGEKYVRKEGGKTITQKCPNCAKQGEFYEVVKAEYVSFFFVPIYTQEKESKKPKIYFECSNCSEKYAFAGIRFVHVQYVNSFWNYLRKLFTVFRDMPAGFREKSKEKKMARDIEKELKNMKRTIKKEQSKGDR